MVWQQGDIDSDRIDIFCNSMNEKYIFLGLKKKSTSIREDYSFYQYVVMVTREEFVFDVCCFLRLPYWLEELFAKAASLL